jgi:hypothetical protein
MDRPRPDLRPLGIGEMIDAAIRMFRSNFLTLIKISAAVLGPLGLIQLIATVVVGPVDFSALFEIDPNADPADAFAPFVPAYTVLGVTSLVTALGSVLVQGASITALAQVYQGIEPDWRSSLRAGLRRFFPLFVSTVIVYLVAGIGLLLCIAPGVFLWTMWSVSPAALVTEQKGPVAAMTRSWQLVRGRFWPTLGAVALGYLLYYVVSQIISVVTGVITVAGAMASESFSFVPTVLGTIIVSILSAPFLAAMVTIIYFDLRVRKEGYDLELMAGDLTRMEGNSHLGAPPPASDDNPFGLDNPGSR